MNNYQTPAGAGAPVPTNFGYGSQPTNYDPNMGAGYQPQSYPHQAQSNAPKEGDVRYIENENNRFRVTGHIMSCTKVNKVGKSTIVDVQISVPHDKNDGTFNIVTFMGAVADRALKLLSIGDKITVTGEIRSNSFVPQGTNQKVFSTNMNAANFEFAESQAGKEFRIKRKAYLAQINGQPAPIVESIGDNFHRRQAQKQQQQQQNAYAGGYHQ